ncbi:mitochondrial chaperone BCS1 [Aureococcus anophagefferens]|uniref:Mitochondrial chaperone BCS1 n=1 Tax=Aureococcus anophagefferens TaxID=44056 RepID=A0ABR1G968_AURAN
MPSTWKSRSRRAAGLDQRPWTPRRPVPVGSRAPSDSLAAAPGDYKLEFGHATDDAARRYAAHFYADAATPADVAAIAAAAAGQRLSVRNVTLMGSKK